MINKEPNQKQSPESEMGGVNKTGGLKQELPLLTSNLTV